MGPLDAKSGESLTDTFARVKQNGRSTVLYWDARSSRLPPPHFIPDGQGAKEESQDSDRKRLRVLAAEALAELTEKDARIEAISTDIDPLVPTAWESAHEIWRQSNARRLPSSTAPDWRPTDSIRSYSCQWKKPSISWARSAEYLCKDRLGVTLIIESRTGSAATKAASSATLAGFRQLPHASLLSPKDAAELCQMLSWCASQTHPTVIWLPEEWTPPVTWPRGDGSSPGSSRAFGSGLRGGDLCLGANGSRRGHRRRAFGPSWDRGHGG